MVRAVRTEHQISNCDVKCRVTFSFQWMFHVYGLPFGWKTSMMFLLKYCKMEYLVFIYLCLIFFLCDNRKKEGTAKHYGRFTNFLLDDFAFLPNFLRTCVIVRACCAHYYLSSLSVYVLQEFKEIYLFPLFTFLSDDLTNTYGEIGASGTL